MGHKTNPIGFRLALTTFWNCIFVTTIRNYKKTLQQINLIKEICNHCFTDYSVPEFLPDTLRNDKKLEQKDRKIQENLIANSFAENNLIYADTVVIKGKQLELQNKIFDGNLLNKKTMEAKDLKNIDSSFLQPKPYKRFLPTSLLLYINKLKNNVKTIKRKWLKKIKYNLKRFKLIFRKSNQKRLTAKLSSNKNTAPVIEMIDQKKSVINAHRYTITRLFENTNQANYFILQNNKKIEENYKTQIHLPMKKLMPLTTQIKQNETFVSTNVEAEKICISPVKKKISEVIQLFTNFSVFFARFLSRKPNKNWQKKLKTKGTKRLRRLKSFAMFLYSFFGKQRQYFELLVSGANNFNLLKSLIVGIAIVLYKPLKFRIYYLMFFKELLKSLFVLCIGFVPKFLVLKILTALILQEQCQKHNQILKRRNLFSARYLIYFASNSVLISAIKTVIPKIEMTISFVGLHIRNMSATLLKKYILRKLSQYFTIQEILKPIIFDLKRSPLLYGFRIIIAGRVTRKERAAFLIKSMKNLPLNKKVAKIDYAAGAKIQKFGMVGMKVFLYIKNIRTSFYRYSFNNNNVIHI